MFFRPCRLFRYLFRYTCSGYQFATLEMRRKMFQVNFWKDLWDCHWRQGKNWPIAGQRISNDNPGSLCKSKLSQGFLPHLEWQMGLALSILPKHCIKCTNKNNELWKTVRLTSLEKPTILIHFLKHIQVCPSIPNFVSAVLLIPSFTVL